MAVTRGLLLHPLNAGVIITMQVIETIRNEEMPTVTTPEIFSTRDSQNHPPQTQLNAAWCCLNSPQCYTQDSNGGNIS